MEFEQFQPGDIFMQASMCGSGWDRLVRAQMKSSMEKRSDRIFKRREFSVPGWEDGRKGNYPGQRAMDSI
jgi:hypothetical protein